MESTFEQDVIKGLSTREKYLPSKYFYDEQGDKLFCQIMACPEYYVSKSETQIIQNHSENMAKTIGYLMGPEEFNVIELGAGDASKSLIFLKELEEVAERPFHYFPIDISSNVINDLHLRLPDELPSTRIFGITAEYLPGLEAALNMSPRRTLIMFLGSSIGNFTVAETKEFLKNMRATLRNGDLFLGGFDLTTGFGKTPEVILAAYNDKEGITKKFNLNLLARINRELNSDFDLDTFDHRPTYNPKTGECKSYIISLHKQDVHIGAHLIHFEAGESIYTEISQKYDEEQLSEIALATGYFPIFQYPDELGWYVDELWQVH